jgi:UDP-N-acetylmuramyl pentapeptide phosphotransferase/UDP-N-acetylglucosamine-1-phosphate transferase
MPDLASAHARFLLHCRRRRVVERRGKWQESHMANQTQSFGGGIFIVIGIATGTAIGTAEGQPTIGVIGGGLVGIAIAVIVWLRDRKRIGH